MQCICILTTHPVSHLVKLKTPSKVKTLSFEKKSDCLTTSKIFEYNDVKISYVKNNSGFFYTIGSCVFFFRVMTFKPIRSCENSRKQLQIFCSFQIARTLGLILLSNAPFSDQGKLSNTYPLPASLSPHLHYKCLVTHPIQLAHDIFILPPAPSSRYYITSL